MNMSLVSGDGSGENRNERIYRRIEHLIITHQLEPGSRIYPVKLADRLGTSNTPVREALIKLAAKGIIEDRFNAGFFTKTLSQKELEDSFKLIRETLDWSLNWALSQKTGPAILKPPKMFDVAISLSPTMAVDIASDLAFHVARQSGTGCAVEIIDTMNTRTYFVRWKEGEFFPETIEEVTQLCRSYYRSDLAEFRPVLRDYHDARIARLPDLLRLIRHAGSDASAVRTLPQLDRPIPDSDT